MNVTHNTLNDPDFFLYNILPSMIISFLLLIGVFLVWYHRKKIKCDPRNLNDKEYHMLFGKSMTRNFLPDEKELENF